jgi:hypothetical protein
MKKMAYERLVLGKSSILDQQAPKAARMGARPATKGNPNPREKGFATVVRLYGRNSPNLLRR